MRWFGWLRRKTDEDSWYEDEANEPESVIEAHFATPEPSFGNLSVRQKKPRFHSGREGFVRARIRTAFTPSQPVSDPAMFAGRTELMQTAIRAIEDQQLHLVLYGERGIGKTSMLHVLADLAREAGYIVRYASCGEDSGFSETFRAIARDIPLLYHHDIDPTSERAEQGGSLSDLAPDDELTAAQISELFAKLVGARAIIILDEFDRSEPTQFRRRVAELIKGLSDRSAPVQLVIGGVASNLNELVEHLPSIKRNVLGLPVATMAEEEIADLIRIGSEVSRIAFSPDVVQELNGAAHGSPYLATLLAQHAGLTALDANRSFVSKHDVHAAIERAAAEMGQRFSPQLLYDLERVKPPAIMNILYELADEALDNGGYIDAPEIGEFAVEPMERARMLQKLEGEYQLIRPTPQRPGGGYEFREDGLASYLWLRKLSSLQPEQ